MPDDRLKPKEQFGAGQKIPALREIIEERKGKAVETLSVSYAKNKLPLEEYERLVEYINKIESERELAVVEKIVAEYEVPDETESARETYSPREETADYHHDEYDHDGYESSNSYTNLTLLSSRKFQGTLKSGSQFVSIMGSGRITVRREDLERRQTVVNVVSIFGDSTIFVEPGIRVANRVVPIMGDSKTDRDIERVTDRAVRTGRLGGRKTAVYSDEPELIISGSALFGEVRVKLLKE